MKIIVNKRWESDDFIFFVFFLEIFIFGNLIMRKLAIILLLLNI